MVQLFQFIDTQIILPGMLFNTQTFRIKMSVTIKPILHCVTTVLCNKPLLWETFHSTVKSTRYCCTLEEEVQPKCKLFKRYTGCSCSKRQTSYQKRPKQIQMYCRIKFYNFVSYHNDFLHFLSFRFLWPCIVSKLWSERENQQDATVRCLLSIFSQQVLGIIMPIFRRTRHVLLHVVYCAGSAGCGW